MVSERTLSRIFWERLCDKSAKGDNTLASVEKVLQQRNWYAILPPAIRCGI